MASVTTFSDPVLGYYASQSSDITCFLTDEWITQIFTVGASW